MRPASGLRCPLAAFALVLCLGRAPVGAQTAQAAPAPATMQASPSPAATPAAASGLQALRVELGSRLGAADFPARLESAAASLPPADAVSLLTEFAPRVADSIQSRAMLVRAGELALLLGEYQRAAWAWEAAAGRIPGQRDDALLLRAARAWLAAGDADRAGKLATLLLLSAPDPLSRSGARLVAAWSALIGDRPGEAAALTTTLLAENAPAGSGSSPEAATIRREALFIQWAAAPMAEHATRLADLAREFPGSPEALIAAGDALARILPRPHWYLSGISLHESGTGASPAGTSVAAAAITAAPASPTSPAAAPAPASETVRFQVGAFSRAENAERLRKELAGRGFRVQVETRTGKGGPMILVIVEGGKDPDATRLALKDAGWEAFPL